MKRAIIVILVSFFLALVGIRCLASLTELVEMSEKQRQILWDANISSLPR